MAVAAAAALASRAKRNERKLEISWHCHCRAVAAAVAASAVSTDLCFCVFLYFCVPPSLTPKSPPPHTHGGRRQRRHNAFESKIFSVRHCHILNSEFYFDFFVVRLSERFVGPLPAYSRIALVYLLRPLLWRNCQSIQQHFLCICTTKIH